MNSFKTIFTRYQSVKEGKKFDPDNEPLSNVEKSLNRVGIAIRKDKDHFKDFNIVVEEIGKKWKMFNDIEKSTITNALAGTRNRENLLVLFENINQVHDLQKKMEVSAGSAEEKFKAYGDSVEAKVADLKHTVEDFWSSLIKSETVGKVIDTVRTLVKYLDAFMKTSTSTKISLVLLGITVIGVTRHFVTFFKLLISGKASMSALGLATQLLIGKEITLATMTGKVTALLRTLGVVMKTLFTTAGGWIFMGVAVGIAGITHAITKNIQHTKELKEQTDNLKSSYKDLTQAMKENNAEQIKSSMKEIKDKTKPYTDALKKKKELEKQIANMDSERDKGYFDRSGLFDSQKYSKLQTELKKTNKFIGEQIQILKNAGIAFNEATGKVEGLAQAESFLKADDIKKKEEAKIKELDKTLELITAYQNLNAVENKNATQKAQLSTLALDLKDRIHGLITATDEHGNTVIVNTDLLKRQIEIIDTEKGAVINTTNARLASAKNDAVIEVGKTKVVYSEVGKRIDLYKAEADALRGLANKYEQADKLIRVGLDDNNPLKKQQNPLSNMLNSRAKELEKESGALDSARKKIDEVYSRGTPDIPNVGGSSGGSSGSGYMPPSGGDDEKKKKSSADKAKSDAEKAQRDAEQALKKALDNAINQYDYAIKTIENKITNARNRMELYNEDGDKWGNRVVLTKQIETFTNQKISQLEAKKRFIQNSINSGKYDVDTIKDLKSKILDINGTLSDVYTSLKKIKMELIDETYKQKTVEIIKEIERLKNKMEEIDSADTFNKQKLIYMDSMIEKIKQQRNVTQSYVNELERQIRATRDIATRSALEDSIKKYREELQSLQIEIIKSMTDRKNLIKDLTFEIEKLDEFNRVIEETNENLRKHNYLLADLDLQIELLKEKMDFEGVDKLYGDYISAMNGKIVELRNQSKELSSAMDGLQKEFKLKFGVDISSMSKKDLNNLYQSMFATRVTGSKEEKEALEKQAELFKRLMDDYYQLTEAIQENGEALGGMTNDILKKQKEQADYILNLQKELQDKAKDMMLKHKDDEKKILDERLKNFKEFIDKRQKELDKTWKQEDYDRDLQKKKEEEAKLIAEIESKRRDTSLQGQTEVKRLEEELTKLQEDISNFERDHNRDMIKENLNDQLEKADKENEEANKKLDEFYSDENLNKMSYEAIAKGYFKDIHGNTIMLKDAMIDYIKTTSDGLSVIGQKIQDEIIAKLIGLQVFFKNGLNFGGINNIGTPISNPIVMNPIGGGIGDNGSIDIGKLIGGNIQPIIPNPIMPTPIVNIPMNSKTNENPIMFNIDCINKIEGNMYDTNDLIRMIEQGGTKVIQTVQDYFNGKGWRTSF